MTNTEYLTLLKKNPIGVGCGVLSLVLAAGIYYRGGQVPDVEAELAQRSAEGQRYSANLKNAVQMKEHLDGLVAANAEIDRRLVHVGQSLTNSQFFYKLESDSGVKLGNPTQTTTVAPKAAGKTAFVPVGFSISVQGNLAQLLGFLRRLESGAHYCRVLSVTCTGSPSDPNAPLNLTLSLELLGLP
jgi:hypothetical protein